MVVLMLDIFNTYYYYTNLIKYNQKPLLYRVVGLLLYLLLFTDNYKLFVSRNKYSKPKKAKKISNQINLADLVFKNNDWGKNKTIH